MNPRRVAVVGSSGAGKSTLTARVADRLGVPHIELDAIFHQPDWTPLPTERFREAVTEVTSGEGWVVDGNYSTVRDLVWTRAHIVLWLDYPRWVVTPRVVTRTLRRVATGEELWNGNRER